MGNIISMQGIRTLHGATTDDLKMEKINEGIASLAGIDIILIIIIISLVIHIISFKKGFDKCARYEKID